MADICLKLPAVGYFGFAAIAVDHRLDMNCCSLPLSGHSLKDKKQ